ncbi:hypothetical protein [Candidatus Methylomirabilis sp.]|uniref:hypothetical protein n=1 Tax=Candidatus Methylomirabilis sp. TaxID=2032687 RepID=UPI003076614A
MRDVQQPMTIHTTGTCPNCAARRVPGASACWQCGGTFATLPTAQAPSQRWIKVPWVGVLPLGLFFLPWAVAGPYWAHRVVSIAGLELALGRTLRGRPVLHEPLLWLVPAISLLLAALLFRIYRRAPGPQYWLLAAITAWAGFLLLLFKAAQWLLGDPSPGAVWVVHWLTTWFLLTSAAFFVSALSAIRTWMSSTSPRPQSSSSPSQDAPFDEGQIR